MYKPTEATSRNLVKRGFPSETSLRLVSSGAPSDLAPPAPNPRAQDAHSQLRCSFCNGVTPPYLCYSKSPLIPHYPPFSLITSELELRTDVWEGGSKSASRDKKFSQNFDDEGLRPPSSIFLLKSPLRGDLSRIRLILSTSGAQNELKAPYLTAASQQCYLGEIVV